MAHNKMEPDFNEMFNIYIYIFFNQAHFQTN